MTEDSPRDSGPNLLENFGDILSIIAQRAIDMEEDIAVEAGSTDLGKRQTDFEDWVRSYLPEALEESASSINFRVEVEGWKPFEIYQDRKADYFLFVDSLDGTANTCRWAGNGSRDIPSPFCTVISLFPAKEDLKFGDAILGAVVDLYSGQCFIAQVGYGAWIGQYDEPASSMEKMFKRPQYNKHSPLLACEFYRHINWVTRLLVNQAVEWSDMASSAMNILRVLLGEADCFFNNVVPELSPEGQRGHELGAMMPFVAELNACAIDTRTGKNLAETPFTFDGMTPVIIGIDLQTVAYYKELIQDNLQRPDVKLLIAQLHSMVGTQFWSLRELPK